MDGKPGYGDRHETIKSIIEITTRVDERVQHIVNEQGNLAKRFSEQAQTNVNLGTKIQILEISMDEIKKSIPELREEMHKLEMRLGTVEQNSNFQDQRWKVAFGFIIQLVWVILAAYLLYKLGIQTPQVP